MKTFADFGIHINRVKGGNQKTTCPNCSPTRKNKLDPCLSVNLDDGTFYCHHCEWKGSTRNNNGDNKKNKIIETYNYKDESSSLVYQSVRFDPKSFRQRRPDGNGGWTWNLKDVHQVPYRLPELTASVDMVYITGGEKDVESLVKHGLTATTNSGGEGNWKQEFNEYLKNRDVVILEDNDSKGQKHGKTISEGLMGIAKTIKIVRFPELPKGGDISDYLTIHNIEEFIKLVEETPIFQGSYKEHFCDVTGNSLNILDHTESWNQIRELDIKVEWIVDHLIPKGAIIILFGKGGIGKTWLVMDIARCIGSGIDYLGYATQETLVIFVDFENPLTVLNTRTQRMGEAEGVHFWRVANDLKPPKLDSDDWKKYKELPHGTVLIFDTLRASHSKDENSSEHMAMVMERVKELRDCGFTVILLHHTPKNSEKISKGSTAIVDLADHILNLSRVRRSNGGDDKLVDDDDDDEEAVYRFGVREKTRFEPHHIYLTLNPDRGFELAPDPEEETLEKIRQLLLDTGPLPKTALAKECKTLDLGQKKALKLIERGTGRFWRVESTGQKNAQVVTSIQIGSSATPIGSEKLPNCPDDKLEPDKQESFVI